MAKSRTKIAFFIGSMCGGGAERFFATVLNGLDREEFEPTLLLLTDEIAYPLPPDIPVRVLGKARPWHIPVSIKRLARYIDEMNPDVIFSSIWLYNLIAGYAIKLSRRKPYWISRVVSPPDQHSMGPYKYFVNRAYEMADCIQAASKGVADILQMQVPTVKGRIQIIEDLTDFDRIDQLSEQRLEDELTSKPLVMAMGRFVQSKRYDVLISAFSTVHSKIDSHLLLIGDGPLRQDIHDRVSNYRLSHAVTFCGFIANPYPILRRASVFIHGADYEGLSIALVEAQGLGIPAVATDCPYGPREIIEHTRTGFLVPIGDENAMAAHICTILNNENLRKQMSQKARIRARTLFSWERRKAELFACIERELVSHAHKRLNF